MRHERVPVRIAEERDIEGVMRLCWAAHAERNERTPSDRKARIMVSNCIGRTGDITPIQGTGVIGLIEVDGDYRAMCGLVISSPWCSEDFELYDWLVYVRTDCRHLRYLTPLLTFAKAQAIRLGVTLWMGWIGDERAEAKSHAYERHFTRYGAYYRYNPKG